MKKSIFLLLLLACSAITLFSQTDKRLAQGLVPIEKIASLPLPAQDTEALLSEEIAKRTSGRAPKYAVNIPVLFTPQSHGLWETIKGDRMINRMKIKSSGAEAINLGFTRYNMPVGGQLFLYSSDYQEVFGPFTPADNEEHEQLWTPNITGDEIIVEIQIPKSAYKNLDIELGFVNHAFQKFSSAGLLSGSCNLDVICGTADGWGIVEPHRDIIQSVAVISTGGGTFCTGFLISNANQDCTPLFMTANHCGIDGSNAASLVTYWNFFNSTCRQPDSAASGNNGDGSLADFNTGATFRATNAASDFVIVELDDPVSETANAYFAGYDASGAQPTSAIGVHHPSTDEKRISFEDDPTEFTTYGSANPTTNYTHVRVVDWDTGTTEGGSSGSPLFDQDERIIGQLHGGGAACGNNSSDWYGSLAVSWEGGGTSTTRLRDWLDPNNTGTLVNNGYYAGNCDFSVLTNPGSQDVCPPTNAIYTLTVSDAFTSNVTLSISDLPAGLNASFSNNNVSPGGSTSLTISNTSNSPAGSFTFNINGSDGTNTSTNSLVINILPSAGSAPTYSAPNNGITGLDPFPTLSWTAETGLDYNIEIATNASFSNIIETATVSGSSYSSTNTGNALTTYYWRIAASSDCGSGSFGAGWSFTTANVQCVGASTAGLELTIGPNNGNTTVSVLNIPNDALISDVNVTGIDLTHTWINDLTISLTSPTGQQVLLMEQICDDEDNMLMNFDDQAASLFTDIPCPPTDGQTYQPFEALSAFNDLNAQGDWTLTITDNANQDGGTFAGWNLQVCFAEAAATDLIATAEVTENNECFEEEEGVIQVTATEGTPPYTYSLDGAPFQNDDFFEELGAGTYSVTVMDATGMTVTVNGLTVTHPSDVSAVITVNEDDVTINPSGGTEPFTYSLNGTDFQTGNTFNNLANGEYVAFIEDFNGCSIEESFTIAVNSVTLSAAITQTIFCFDGSNAIITATAGGGQAPYTFSISGGNTQNNGTFDNLPAGTYQITVQDSEGFSQMTAPIIITSPAQLNIAANVDGNNVTAIASGGTGSLLYSIDGGNYQTSTQFNDLSNGTYTLYVQDSNDCIQTTNFTIEVNNLMVLATFERILCFDEANGAIIVNASGGSTPYSYSLNGGNTQSSNIFSPLGPDTYEITVTDNDGFTQTTNPITLINPDELVLAALVDENEITAFGNGGTGDLLYSITGSSYQSNNIFPSLSNGTYTVFVLDENGCTATQDVTIAVNSLTASAQADDISCNGNNDGTVIVTAAGGQEPYTYSIDGTNFQDSQFFFELSTGTYEITVQDADGFTQVTNTVSIAEPTTVTLSTTTNVDEITVNAMGGTGNFQYSIDGVNYQDSNVFSGLENGTYTVSVFDENECLATTTAVISVNSLTITTEATNISCHDENDGTITALIGGGQEPYIYSIDGENFQDSPIFDNLTAGEYTITAQDANEISVTSSVINISNPETLTVSVIIEGTTITAVGAGGIVDYMYSIDGEIFQESPIFNDVLNGTYTIYIIDANECTNTTEATIAVNDISGIAVIDNQISCFGDSNGAISVSVSGGNEPFQYSIDGGMNYQSDNYFEGLSAAEYSVIILDNDGFTFTTEAVLLPQPTELQANSSVTDNLIVIMAEGGTSPYFYSINDGEFTTGNAFEDLVNGSYDIIVQDFNGCEVFLTEIIDINTMSISLTIENNISCFNEEDGIIVVNVMGGTAPFMYSIDGENFQESNVFTGLAAGAYSFTVTDAQGALTETTAILLTNPEPLFVSANTDENLATLTGTGGTGDYLYSVDGETFQSDGNFMDLVNGDYTGYVQDANGCIAETQFTILSIDLFAVAEVTQNIDCFGDEVGIIEINASGGTAPYTYSIDGDSYVESNIFTELSAGIYTCYVEDANGNIYEAETVTITESALIILSAQSISSSIIASAEGGVLPYQFSIDGDNFQDSGTFNDLPSGEYPVTIIDALGCTETLMIVIDVVGTEDISNNINFSIYPNPSTGTFSIELENEIRGALTISIYNIIGQRLFEGNTIKGNDLLSYKISDLELPTGTYEVLVKGGDYFGTKKVVVVR